MIRIALVEDDPAYAEQLLSYLKEYEIKSLFLRLQYNAY